MKAQTVRGDSGWTEAAEVISRGGLVVFPTDTVYGVGCHPHSVQAIERIFAAKGRSHLKAIPVLLSDSSGLARVAATVPQCATALADRFWPGGLSVVVPRHLTLPALLGPEPTIAVRVPDHDMLRAMIRSVGGAIAATSANLSGEPDALNASDAAGYLGDRVDLIVDGGECQGGVPSSVIDCTTPEPRVLREGAISSALLLSVLGVRER